MNTIDLHGTFKNVTLSNVCGVVVTCSRSLMISFRQFGPEAFSHEINRFSATLSLKVENSVNTCKYLEGKIL